MQLLAGLCAELQRRAGEAEFFLSCRSAGALLGLPYRQASRMLKRLEHEGLLTCTERGTPGPRGRASRFRWEGGAL
jgi:hypothetical protein